MSMSNVERFESILSSIDRTGMDKLIAYIRKSDFYTAPASTRFHSCHEGGLLEHSLNVYDCLISKRNSDVWKDTLKNVPDESFAIAALCHDICKTNFYSTEVKNRKVYKPDGSKKDSVGNYDWESYNAYTINDKVPYGHGEKSVMMLEEFIKLKAAERYAIRWHMGYTEPKENWNTFSAAIKLFPLCLALHISDLEATHLMETDE